GALDAVAGWDVPHAAAAVVDAGHDEAVETVGDQDHRFPLASVTKLLTAYACLVAVEEGTLELGGPVEPQGTVRHLLAHAAGYGLRGPGRAPGVTGQDVRRRLRGRGRPPTARHVRHRLGRPLARPRRPLDRWRHDPLRRRTAAADADTPRHHVGGHVRRLRRA